MKALSAGIGIVIALLGCSSSSSNAGNCGNVAACGGDVVGTWKIINACTDATSSSTTTTGCAGETVQPGSFSVSGTVTFNADMTYVLSLTESASDTLTVPASCLSAGGTTVTCSELTAALGGAGVDDAGTTTTCSAAGSSCNCDIVVAGQTTNEMGTYTLSGNTLTTTSSTSTGTTGGGDYCVQGNTLHLISTTMGTGSTMGTPASDLVATKQ